MAGNIDLTKEEKKQLVPYKKDLRRVGVKNNTPWRARRGVIMKMGKAISLLARKTLEQ